MGKSLKADIRIFILLAMLPVLVALTGCGKNRPETPEEFSVRYFSVSGVVYDSSESLPGEPLNDISVSLTAYWYYDTDHESPLYSGVVRTGADGRYHFYIRWPMSTQNVFYVLKVTDDSKLRTVHFKSVTQELYLRSHTDTYDYISSSYEVKDNDFYLYPESL